MPPRLPLAILMVLAAAALPAAQDTQTPDLKRHIDTLSSFDYSPRMNAARALRRAPATAAVAALEEAVRRHPDQFVRYRALVLLTSFNDGGTPDLMRGLLTDRNDRVREVAYRWLERQPDSSLTPALIAALNTEQSEFVRPALVRAVAALPHDERVERALVAEIGRGFDFFRSAVIEALGEHRAAYAVDAIAPLALADGALQDDAVLALGRIGDRRALQTLSSLTNPPAEVAPAVQAAQCLLGALCPLRREWLVQTARSPESRVESVRAAVAALGVMAQGDPDTRLAIVRLTDGASERLRREAALAFSGVALRQPSDLIAWLAEQSADVRARATDLLREGFESLEEDFAEEQFFAAARGAYWNAAEQSPARAVAAALIDKLEF